MLCFCKAVIGPWASHNLPGTLHVPQATQCTLTEGLVTLSFKKGDRLDPKNWRPISLLNVDYKIASRSIAARLLKVIHLVVGKDQSCGVPGRFIGENVAFLRDVVDFCSSSGLLLLFFLLIKERHSTGLIGRSFVLLYMPWVLGSRLLGGLIYFTIM